MLISKICTFHSWSGRRYSFIHSKLEESEFACIIPSYSCCKSDTKRSTIEFILINNRIPSPKIQQYTHFPTFRAFVDEEEHSVDVAGRHFLANRRAPGIAVARDQ